MTTTAVDWRERAACKDSEIDFFPDRGGEVRAAKALCASCPVRLDCLAYAIENVERHGIWGGLSERQRRKIRTRQPGRNRMSWEYSDDQRARRQRGYRARKASA